MGSDPINFRGVTMWRAEALASMEMEAVKIPLFGVNRGICIDCEIYSVFRFCPASCASSVSEVVRFVDHSSSSLAEMPGLVMAWVSRILSMFSWVRMPFWRMRSFTEAPVRIASFAMSAACS